MTKKRQTFGTSTKPTSYLNENDQPEPGRIERMTRCLCDKPNPIQQDIGEEIVKGAGQVVHRYQIVCLKCGKEVA